MTSAPSHPAAPPNTPPLLVTLASIALAFAGPVLAFVDPDGKINTGSLQAAIILGFLLVALLLWSLHVAVAAVHRYGWTKTAGAYVISSETAEVHTLLPEIQSTYALAAPLLDKLPEYAGLAGRVTTVEGRLDAIPASQRDAAKAVLLEALAAPTGEAAPTTVTPPVPPVA